MNPQLPPADEGLVVRRLKSHYPDAAEANSYLNESPLVQNHKRHHSVAHKLANQLVLAYMGIGLALPVGGTCMALIAATAWLTGATNGSDSNPILATVSMVMGTVGTFAMVFSMLWVLMSPLCLLIMLRQRRFVGLLPALFCGTWIGFFSILMRFENQVPKEALFIITMGAFAIGAYYGTKVSLKVMKEIKREPPYALPKILGCHKSHTADEVTAS